MGKNFCPLEQKWCKYLKHNGTCGKEGSAVRDVVKCPRIAAIETKTVADIINNVTFDDVFTALVGWFPDQYDNRDGYEKAFADILNRKPRKHRLNDLYIHIEKEVEDGREYANVNGKDMNTGRKYGIEFCSWDDWVTMFITEETLEALTNEEIVAACLYEMTFFGYSEGAVIEQLDTMQKNVEEAMEKYEKKYERQEGTY